jgi:hypothetical protein
VPIHPCDGKRKTVTEIFGKSLECLRRVASRRIRTTCEVDKKGASNAGPLQGTPTKACYRTAPGRRSHGTLSGPYWERLPSTASVAQEPFGPGWSFSLEAELDAHCVNQVFAEAFSTPRMRFC